MQTSSGNSFCRRLADLVLPPVLHAQATLRYIKVSAVFLAAYVASWEVYPGGLPHADAKPLAASEQTTLGEVANPESYLRLMERNYGTVISIRIESRITVYADFERFKSGHEYKSTINVNLKPLRIHEHISSQADDNWQSETLFPSGHREATTQAHGNLIKGTEPAQMNTLLLHGYLPGLMDVMSNQRQPSGSLKIVRNSWQQTRSVFFREPQRVRSCMIKKDGVQETYLLASDPRFGDDHPRLLLTESVFYPGDDNTFWGETVRDWQAFPDRHIVLPRYFVTWKQSIHSSTRTVVAVTEVKDVKFDVDSPGCSPGESEGAPQQHSVQRAESIANNQ